MHTRTTAAAVILAASLTLTGCSGGGHDAASAATTAPPVATVTTPALSTEDAYREYQQAAMNGCTTVEDCQTVMTARLAAVHDLRAAMKAADPARFAEPIADIDRADRLATQYGEDNLGAAGTMAAVMQPIQAAITWYASNR